MQIIDGKLISQKVKDEIKEEIENKNLTPGLAVILVGQDKASATYVASKEKACAACGIKSFAYKFEEISEDKLLNLIDDLNKNDKIDGILVQLPLPKNIDTNKILEKIDPKKDVDGFSAINFGRLVSGLDGFVPCTPLGIMRLLKEYKIEVSGKDVVVIGRSNIVGKPMAFLMINESATVTVCNSKTKNLKDITKNADILVVAIRKPLFLKADMVKENSVIIDVGINRLDNGKLVGDVDFDEVSKKASFITPVPGGVGPMTIAMLLQNTLNSAKKRNQR